MTDPHDDPKQRIYKHKITLIKVFFISLDSLIFCASTLVIGPGKLSLHAQKSLDTVLVLPATALDTVFPFLNSTSQLLQPGVCCRSYRSFVTCASCAQLAEFDAHVIDFAPVDFAGKLQPLVFMFHRTIASCRPFSFFLPAFFDFEIGLFSIDMAWGEERKEKRL